MYKTPKLIWIILGLLLAISLVSLVIAVKNPSGHSYPYEVQNTPAPIDYQKIKQIVAQDIAALPKPLAGNNGLNGANGQNGLNGVSGINGVDGTDGQSIIGPEGMQGEPGPQGDSGVPGKTIELQYDSIKAEIDWRYTGDFSWHTLVTACTLTNTCP